MYFQKILVPIAGVAVVVLAYRGFGWPGVAAAVGGLLMWVLLHFTRMMQVLRRASDQPIGYVASAVMLNAKLRPGLTLMHVVAMTRSLGALRSAKDTQPEIFVWTDTAGSSVTCTFVGGKLSHYELFRPVQPDQQGPAPTDSGQAPPSP
ncbi:glycerate kinase [Polaromonas sp.]|uniref:glycerate kinase n=1 Tax=Polaromonas sp. TaxID=1869339 RepID=UPI0037511D93